MELEVPTASEDLPPRAPALLTALGGPTSECKHTDVLPDVVRIFASCDSNNVTIANALPRLARFHTGFPVEFKEALLRCTDMVIRAETPRCHKERSTEVAVELLAAVAANTGLPTASQVMGMAVSCLGGTDVPDVEAPRDKSVRHRCAELLWRLLAALLQGGPCTEVNLEAVEVVFLRLCLDKAPAVRHAAVLGLALLASPQATMVLVSMAAREPSPRIRAAVLSQLPMQEAVLQQPEYAAVLRRCTMDASEAVRCRFFSALTTLRPLSSGAGSALPAALLSELLLRGLGDASAAVRRETEQALRAWLSAEDQSRTVHALLRRLEVTRCRTGEAAAELVIRKLLREPEWCVPAETTASTLLSDQQQNMSPEQVFLARMIVSCDPGVWNAGNAMLGPEVFMRIFASLDGGRMFELRQLLLVILSADVPSGGGTCRPMLHTATAVLLHAPLGHGVVELPSLDGHYVEMAPRHSIFHLAVLLARRALGIHSDASMAELQRAESEFSEAMLVIVRVLCDAKSGDGSEEPTSQGGPTSQPQPGVETLDALSRRTDQLAAAAQVAAKSLAELRNAKAGHVSRGNYLDARDIQAKLGEAQRRCKEAEAMAVGTSKALSMCMWRVLGILEAVLTYSRADLGNDFGLSLLLEDVLRPALASVERELQRPMNSQGTLWPALRVLALRCIALHASLCRDTALQHWPFFMSVLAHYVPTTISAKPGSEASAAIEAVLYQGILFLTDVLMCHCSAELGNTTSPHSEQFFVAIAPMLRAAPHCRGGPSQRLLRMLGQRICSVLLVHTPLEADSLGGRAPVGLQWSLTWLLLQAFVQHPPEALSPKNNGDSNSKGELEAVEAAVMRGRLLHFFGVLSELSRAHAVFLAAAVEGFLSVGLWQLGQIVQVCNGLRWCAVPLPRLVRYLGGQLMASAGAPGMSVELAVQWWLESLWRPLALACLEEAAVTSAAEAELPQALLAALTALAPRGASLVTLVELGLVPVDIRSTLAVEVAWVLNRSVELWGWNTPRGGGLPPHFLELRERFAAASLAACASHDVDWALVYNQADQARRQICVSAAKLGVDVRAAVAATLVVATTRSPPEPRKSMTIQRRGGRGGRGRRQRDVLQPPGELTHESKRGGGHGASARSRSRAHAGSSMLLDPPDVLSGPTLLSPGFSHERWPLVSRIEAKRVWADHGA